MGEHVVEAASGRIRHFVMDTDAPWERCYASLVTAARQRIAEEVARLGGDCAHVLGESVESKHDGATGEGWLAGRFTYMLYRVPR